MGGQCAGGSIPEGPLSLGVGGAARSLCVGRAPRGPRGAFLRGHIWRHLWHVGACGPLDSSPRVCAPEHKGGLSFQGPPEGSQHVPAGP